MELLNQVKSGIYIQSLALAYVRQCPIFNCFYSVLNLIDSFIEHYLQYILNIEELFQC